MTRQELIEVARGLLAASESEAEFDRLLDVLERNVPHPTVSDLIFHPPDGIELSAEEVVDSALAYVPTALAQRLDSPPGGGLAEASGRKGRR